MRPAARQISEDSAGSGDKEAKHQAAARDIVGTRGRADDGAPEHFLRIGLVDKLHERIMTGNTSHQRTLRNSRDDVAGPRTDDDART